jgi:ribosomal protein S27AE
MNSEKSLKEAIADGEVKILEDRCPKCGKALLTEGETMWCSNTLCDYEWFP